MFFKTTVVAMTLTSLLLTTADAGERIVANNSDNQNITFSASVENADALATASYVIQLTKQAKINNTLIGKQQHSELDTINNQQNELITEIKQLEPAAKILQRTRLISNSLYVSMTSETMHAIKQNSNVQNIVKIDDALLSSKAYPTSAKTLTSAKQDSAYVNNEESDDEYIPPVFHNLKVKPANGNVTVAIIGSGVDYTHGMLGGEGTQEAFYDAFSNVSNAWSGFPTDTVIGGFDFSGEGTAYDYNPIEYPVSFEDPYRSFMRYDAGRGTMAASMILQSTPNAKIYSYKVYGATMSGLVRSERSYNVNSALEMAIDPNQDGDLSDRPDILLIDSRPGGIFSFYDEYDEGISGNTVEVHYLRMIAASGTLVVVAAGDHGEVKAYYTGGNRSLVPEAITVGYSEREGGKYSVANHSPIGPTRGKSVLKPDVLAVHSDAKGAIAGTGSGVGEIEADNFLTAARVAAIAANLKDQYPELQAHEIKALIANTARIDVASDIGVAQTGAGSVNPLAASNSFALMYENTLLQPSANFGHVDVGESNGFSREITIKNLTDEVQVYSATSHIQGDKVNNQALSVYFPREIILQPNEEITASISIEVDGKLLSDHPMQKATDFTLDNWNQLALSGYIELNHEGSEKSNIHFPWLIMPRATSEIGVVDQSLTVESYHPQLIAEQTELLLPEHDANWRESAEYDITYSGMQAELTNISETEQTYYLFPAITYKNAPREGRENYKGHVIKAIGGGIYPEQQCLSGSKLSLAFSFFNNFDIPLANHFDRIGFRLVQAKLFNKKTLEVNNYDSTNLDKSSREVGILTQLHVTYDENLQPQTRYLDYSEEYDRYNPGARLKTAELATIVSPNSNTVISNICTDKLYHGEINAQTFEEDMGILVGTDRDAAPGPFSPILVHNFSLSGQLLEETFEQNNDNPDEGIQCPSGTVSDSRGNCIQFYTEETLGVSIEQHLGLENSVDVFCGPVENFITSCSIDHESFIGPITFDSPISNISDSIVCDFDANATTAKCNSINLTFDNGFNTPEWQFSVDFLLLLKNKLSLSDLEGISLLTGIKAKLGHIPHDSSEAVQWQDQLTVGPNQSFKVSFLTDILCGTPVSVTGRAQKPEQCLAGAMLVNPTTGYLGLLNDSSSNVSIKPNQTFSVAENAEIGTKIGKVQTSAPLVVSQLTKILIISQEEGAPFQLSADGTLAVRDPQALDFERKKSYRLLLQPVQGNSFGTQQTIDIAISNANDNAPLQVSNITQIELTVGEVMDGIHISQYFDDLDGNGMRFDSDDLPQGLNLDKGGFLNGTPEKAGEFSSSLVIFDGVNTTLSTLEFNIASAQDTTADSEKSSSGGSMAIAIIFLSIMLRRRISQGI